MVQWYNEKNVKILTQNFDLQKGKLSPPKY